MTISIIRMPFVPQLWDGCDVSIPEDEYHARLNRYLYEWRYRYESTVNTIIGLTSPLTTKGDVWGFSTVNARIPVGANGYVLTADSTQALGVKWAAAAGGSVPTGTGFTHITAGVQDAASKKVDLSTSTDVTGVLLTAGMPALTGDVTTPGASLATTLATVNSNVGSFTNPSITVNAKGLITAASSGASAGNLKGQEFTASGTFTTSANTTGLWLTMIGGGGGGNGGVAAATGGNGGGAGEHVIGLFVAVAASTGYTVTVGAGGAGVASNAAAGDGGATSFGSLTAVAGGRGAGTALATQSGAGGGPRGGAVVARGNPGLAGLIGTQESAVHFGGSSGGSGGTTTASAGGIGGSGGPNLGGAAGTVASTQAGGGGGASTFYGIGGAAGNGGANGSNAPAGSYGAAGGGGGGAAATTTGGNGLAGYCLVQWVE